MIENPNKPSILTNREIAAGLIIFRETNEGPKFLLIYQGGNYWNFPKGKLEEGERNFRAALREVWEETGIRPSELSIFNNFRVQDRFVFTRDKQRIFKTITFFLAETKKSRVSISGFHDQGCAWFLYKDALKFLRAVNSRRNLKKAYDLILAKNRVPKTPAGPQGQSHHLPDARPSHRQHPSSESHR
jgi:8-oxo-dGTP pyrophosphatase MutT (NUDIX family)